MEDADFWLAAAAAAPVIGLAHVVNLPNVTGHLKNWWRGHDGRSTGEKISDLCVLLVASSAVVADGFVLLTALRKLGGFNGWEISLGTALWVLVASMFAIIIVPVYDSIATAFTQSVRAIGRHRDQARRAHTGMDTADTKPPAPADSHEDSPDPGNPNHA